MSINLNTTINGVKKNGVLRFFIRHNTAANLLMISLVLLGIAAMLKLNTQLIPTITINSITISTTWTGASPDDVEASVLNPIEAQVRFIDKVDKVSSYATEGHALIRLSFTSDADMTEAMSKVERAVSSVSNLPSAADAPVVTRSERFEPVGFIAVSGPFSEKALGNFALEIRNGLLEFGIDKVDFIARRNQEIAVAVDGQALEKTALSLSDVAGRIASGTLDRPSGNLDGVLEKSLRLFGVGQSAIDMGNIEMSVGQKGERLLLKDIASIKKQFNPDQTFGVMGDNRAIILGISRTSAADTIKTMDLMYEYLEETEASRPDNLDVKTLFVIGQYVEERLSLLISNGASGLVLVLLVLFIFLNARIAFWVAAGIPVAIMATMVVMYLFGSSINMLSMFALLMMLGIIVDDAIVVAEEAETQMRKGMSSMDAAQLAASRMMRPVMAAAITTIAAFLPLAVIQGTIGQIIITFPIVVISVLVASLIECFLILPGHLRHVKYMTNEIYADTMKKSILIRVLGIPLPRPFFIIKKAYMVFRRYFDKGFDAFRDGFFVAVAAFSFRWRWATVALSFAAFIVAIGVVTSGKVPFDYFPQPEGEHIEARVEFSSGTPVAVMLRDLAIIEESLRQVERDLGGVKGSLINIIFSTITGGQTPNAEIAVELTKAETRDIRTKAISKAWQDTAPILASVESLVIEEDQAESSSKEIDYRLNGTSLEVLKKASKDFQEQIKLLPGTSGLDDDFPVGKRELIMKLTAKGGALGFTNDNIANQLRNNFQGITARSFPDIDGDIDVKVTLANQEGSMSSLRSFRLQSPSGRFVQLSEIVTFSERVGPSLIRKFNGKTTINITGDVDPAVMTGDEVRAEIETNILPAIRAKYNLTHDIGGIGQEQQKALDDIMIGGFIGLSLIYITLAWVFASYTRPFVVMMIIPFGFVGAVYGHLIMGFNLTIMSGFGLLGLAGILVNDSIILVTRIDEYISAGSDMYHAAVHGAKDRLRAVLLTSLTTIGGLSPLMFEKSLQAQFLIPLAITMVFGLLAATVLVLILVPATIGVMHDMGNFFSWIWHGKNWRHFTKRAGVKQYTALPKHKT